MALTTSDCVPVGADALREDDAGQCRMATSLLLLLLLLLLLVLLLLLLLLLYQLAAIGPGQENLLMSKPTNQLLWNGQTAGFSQPAHSAVGETAISLTSPLHPC